jgi:putative ABC transport system substrate-binding protein
MPSLTSRAKRIGYLSNGRQGAMFEAFEAGLSALGCEPGRDVVLEARFAQGNLADLDRFARDLVESGVDVIAASGAVAARAAQGATSRIPIVFAAVLSPPALVEIGLAATAQRPGRNVTGFSSFNPDQPAKAIRLLKRLLPHLERVALLSDRDVPHSPVNPGWNPLEWAYSQVALSEEIEPQLVRIHGPKPDLEGAFAAIAGADAQALVVLEMPVTLQHLESIAAAADERRLPAMLPAGHANHGALLNFGTTINDANRAMAGYVKQVLDGADPGELPIAASNRIELVINLVTAARLGIAIAPEISRSADRLIE